VTATASSSLAVAFTIDASASSVCSISGSTVSFIAGRDVRDRCQSGGQLQLQRRAAGTAVFAVAKGDQTITFTSTAPAGAKVGGPTYTVTATRDIGSGVAFTIDAAAVSVCSIAGSTVSFIGLGTCVIDANQAGNGSYNAAPQVQQSFAVAKGDQTSASRRRRRPGRKVGGPLHRNGDRDFRSGGGFDHRRIGDVVCSISGSTVSFLSTGTCVIDANHGGNTNYNAAPQHSSRSPWARATRPSRLRRPRRPERRWAAPPTP